MATKFQCIYDTHPDIPQQGTSFMQCAKCLGEMPSGVSPKEWARQQMSVTREGYFQVWCNRHECNIALIKIQAKGAK